MPTSLAEVRQAAQKRGRVTVAVAGAADHAVLEAVVGAHRLGLAEFILTGDGEEIARGLTVLGSRPEDHRVVPCATPAESAARAVAFCTGGSAGVLMKGFVETSVFMRALLAREAGLRTGRVLAQVGVYEIAGLNRLLLIADVGVVPYPNRQQQLDILRDALDVAAVLGVARPRVAALSAVEKPTPDLPDSLDAEALAAAARDLQLPCDVAGPLALDAAVSPEAAAHKGIRGPVAGRADILLVPNLPAGNMLAKSLVYLGTAKHAGVVAGAAVPVVLTSRSDSPEAKLNSLALASLMRR